MLSDVRNSLEKIVHYKDVDLNKIDATRKDIMTLKPVANNKKLAKQIIKVINNHDIQITEAIKKAVINLGMADPATTSALSRKSMFNNINWLFTNYMVAEYSRYSNAYNEELSKAKALMNTDK